MARISLTPRSTVLNRFVQWYSRRAYGKVADPVKASGHHPGLLWALLRFEQAVARWDKLDPDLKALAVMASAASIGCSWCMDFGYWKEHGRGMDERKLRDVPVWRDSEVYSAVERDVMAYAEAMTANPPEVSDELAARLVGRLGEPAFVELTMMVAVENLRSRYNSALGLTSQGFKEFCELQDVRATQIPS